MQRFSKYSLVLLLLINAGCTAEHVYGSGQAWQRGQCFKIADQDASRDCLKNIEKSYGNYQYESDRAIKK